MQTVPTERSLAPKGDNSSVVPMTPNEVVILFEWDLQQARQYSQREAVRAKMQAAGVLDAPEISFLEEIEQLSR